MKIGFFVRNIDHPPGYENVVSGHVQLPLHTMQLLKEAGHTVELITPVFRPDAIMPNCMPADVAVHYVTDGRRRGDKYVYEVGFPRWIRPLAFARQIQEMRRLIEAGEFDIVHFFGGNRMAHFAGLLKVLGLKTPTVVTFNNGKFPEPWGWATKHFWRRVSAVVTSTEHVQRQCDALGISAHLLRHGLVRQIEQEDGDHFLPDRRQSRVLFWRDFSRSNGADICLAVYDQLAPEFPDVSFDIAVRPVWDAVKGIEEIEQKHSNVHVYTFPYPDGVSLPRLLGESICVLLPYRALSINPQFSILECLHAGTAVVTTTIESNPELISHRRNGFLAPPDDVHATAEAVRTLLNDRQMARRVSQQAAKDVRQTWNWDNYVSELIAIYQGLA